MSNIGRPIKVRTAIYDNVLDGAGMREKKKRTAHPSPVHFENSVDSERIRKLKYSSDGVK